MHTRYWIIIPAIVLVTLLTACFSNNETAAPLADANTAKTENKPVNEAAAKTKAKTQATLKPTPDKTPQQQMEETVDCAALLATHESSTRGELTAGSAVFDLVSYSLGKAQELALQAGLEKSAAKTLYDQKTITYFLAYNANPETQASQNTSSVAQCKKQLQEYEPGAQIQSAINKAKAMASENSQPNSTTTTEKP